nr:glycerophosphodiester phosphodiesterase family protein [uncultured Limnohabitans sp.]
MVTKMRNHIKRISLKLLMSLAISLTTTAITAAHSACNGMELHAHRGSPAAPENSLSALRLAWEGEWDGVEIDLQQLRDRQWVLHHDLTLGRTTTLQGVTSRNTTPEVWREVRLKDRRGRVSDEPAAFLADAISELSQRDDRVINAEIKQVDTGCEAIQSAALVLRQGRPDGRWFLTSGDRRQLQCARQIDPKGYLGQIVFDPQALARHEKKTQLSNKLKPPVIDLTWLQRLQSEVHAPVGVHVDINTLISNPSLLADAQLLKMAVFTYHLGSDREHADNLRLYAKRTGLLPSGAIVDGDPSKFCQVLRQP